jgi:hypothetical protein
MGLMAVCRLRSVVVALLCVGVLLFVFGGAVAVAAAPEVPVTGAPAKSITASSAVFEGVLNPGAAGNPGSYEFVYRQSSSECQGEGQQVVGAGGASGEKEEAVQGEAAGLLPNATYSFCLLARNEAGEEAVGPVVSFTTLTVKPSIDAAASADVASSSADLTAKVDPNGADTTYRFEYGTTSSYGASVPVPDGDAGAGWSDVRVSQHVTGLSANTTYHWRVGASSVGGTITGSDHTFVYDTSGGGLPDNRAYEMVTPPQKNGALIGDFFAGLYPDIAEDGSRVIMDSVQCFAGSVSCIGQRSGEGEPFAFTRMSDGWVTTLLSPPATQFTVNTSLKDSADADTALFGVPTSSGEHLLTRRSDGSFLDIGPLTGIDLEDLGIGTLLTTTDLSHVVYGGAGHSDFQVHENVGSGNAAPVLVGVSGGAGSTDLISECQTALGNGEEGSFNGLSADGRTVFFTALGPCASGSGVNAGVPVLANSVYARIDESRTVLVSGRSPLGCTGGCLSSPVSDAWFVGASEDGSKVFFLSTQQLTDDASQGIGTARESSSCREEGASDCNLYEYDFDSPAGRNLIAVSAGDTSGGGPRVQGVVAISSDGSHVYFVAQGVLSGVANSRGQLAQDGGDNLYVFERDASHPEGHVAFVVTLPPSDQFLDWRSFPSWPNVTPDGRFLVFESSGALTADDSSTTGAEQVFRYDARTGGLVRISIGEGGFNDNGNADESSARIVKASLFAFRAGPPRPDPTMSNDGSYVFFMSPVGLTPQALNEVPAEGGALVRNVYEWHEGHVYLISDGRDVSGATVPTCSGGSLSVCLLGSDGTGANVFFTTADRLVPRDTDTQVDVYDARICTSGEPCAGSAPPVAVCQGEACHGTPSGAPSLLAPGTVAFAGPGNLGSPAPAVAHKKTVIVKKHVKRKGRRRRSKRSKTSARGRRAVRSGGQSGGRR